MATALSRIALLPLLLVACAGDVAPGDFDEVELGDEEDASKADGSSNELYVRASETSLWVRTHLAREDRDGVDTFVLRGRTSRNLVDGRGFVFDDVYGAWGQLGPRSFELAWTAGESRTLLQGTDQFIGLTFATSSTRHDNMTARVVVRPRLAAYEGSSGLYFVYTVRAVVSGGRVVYRVRGNTNEPIASLSASADGVDIPDLRVIDGNRFEIDLLEDHVLALASRSGRFVVRATLASGATLEKSTSMILAVSKLGFTSADAYETWPPPVCTDAVQACIESVPAGATDLGHCGDAVEVLVCAGVAGVTVDDVAIQNALDALDARLAAPEVRADAEGLVGAERADAWLEGARLTGEDRLQNELGRVYPDAAGRDAALNAAIEGAIDLAYAQPLELVEPYAPIPGDAARARHVAADALLAHLAEQDFASTELGRPLLELARVFRARHVASIRAFRETVEPVDGLTPNSDAYVSDWIGLYTEVELDRATQTAVRILVEID